MLSLTSNLIYTPRLCYRTYTYGQKGKHMTIDCTNFCKEELSFIDWSTKDIIETFGFESPLTIHYFKVIEQATNSNNQKGNFWKICSAYWNIQACYKD